MNSQHPILTPLAAVIAGLILSSQLSATVLLSDSFDYMDGELVSVAGGNWSTLDSAYAQTYRVVDEQLVAEFSAIGGSTNREVGAALSSSATTGFVYTSFQFQASVAPTSSAGYIAFLTAEGSTGTRASRLTYRLSDGGLQWGITNTSSASQATWQTATAGDLDTAYLIVTRYDLSTGTSTLWIDPTDELSTSVESTNGTLINEVGGVGLRLRSSVDSGTYALDNYLVGTSWSDVVSTAAVPEPSTYALAAGFFTLGFAAWRRRRA
ncbi:MAG: hypothetical protein Q7P63_17145 [Verrucomicrobiota bacterium JB022]|nr:hypothetical protein [Verrucomicrobiota bacterium JB022]